MNIKISTNRLNRFTIWRWLLVLSVVLALSPAPAAYAFPAEPPSTCTVVGWGKNTNGQATPPAVLSDVVAISAGTNHSLALKSDGTVVGWGSSFGLGAETPPAGLSGVVAISAEAVHSLALKSDGTVVGWGSNSSGETTPPPSLSDVTAI